MARWPRDNQAELIKFYGNPGSSGPGGVAAQLVTVHPPFQMYYDGHPLKGLSFHRKAAPALMAALNEIWDHYGQSQAKIDALGISKCAGTYNPRMVRGSATKWSNHAFGAAIDLNAEENGFNAKSTIPLPVIAAFKRQGFRWGGDYRSRKDPMHFEACDGGEIATPIPVDAPHADGHADTDNDPVVADEFERPAERIQPEDGPPNEPPKSMATSKIGNTQVVAGASAGVIGTAQIVSSIVQPVSDVADQIQVVTDKAGDVIATTKSVVAIPKPGFWPHLLVIMTSPAFVGCVLLAIAVACAATWYWRRQHRQAGV